MFDHFMFSLRDNSVRYKGTIRNTIGVELPRNFQCKYSFLKALKMHNEKSEVSYFLVGIYPHQIHYITLHLNSLC